MYEKPNHKDHKVIEDCHLSFDGICYIELVKKDQKAQLLCFHKECKSTKQAKIGLGDSTQAKLYVERWHIIDKIIEISLHIIVRITSLQVKENNRFNL